MTVSSLFTFYDFYQYLILNMNIKKEVMSFFFFSFCMNSNLIIMTLKQLPISTEHRVKDPHGTRQYGAGVICSVTAMRCLKLEK